MWSPHEGQSPVETTSSTAPVVATCSNKEKYTSQHPDSIRLMRQGRAASDARPMAVYLTRVLEKDPALLPAHLDRPQRRSPSTRRSSPSTLDTHSIVVALDRTQRPSWRAPRLPRHKRELAKAIGRIEAPCDLDAECVSEQPDPTRERRTQCSKCKVISWRRKDWRCDDWEAMAESRAHQANFVALQCNGTRVILARKCPCPRCQVRFHLPTKSGSGCPGPRRRL